tara:strand:+ start:412 stop:936 length:525 start_codon:yes stop_codon:yes gene_type:complete
MGLNSTGALILDHNGTKVAAMTMSSADHVQNSSAMTVASYGATQIEFVRRAQTVTSSIASTLSHGFTSLSSGTTPALTGWEISEPYLGAEAEIYLDCSASGFHLGGTSTDVVFQNAGIASAGSTLFMAGVDMFGVSIHLRGLSSAAWAIMNSIAQTSGGPTINGIAGATTVSIG